MLVYEKLASSDGGKLHNVMRRGGKGAVRPLVRPPGGVAKLALPVPGRLIVSIHAPAGGATGVMGFPSSSKPCFNSRSRGGSDLLVRTCQVSPGSFNSRSRGGSDIRREVAGMGVTAFQFTLPRGERHSCTRAAHQGERFNSRSRGGSDRAGRSVQVRPRGFNSRSRGGSDIPQASHRHEPRRFNSRSRGGSDCLSREDCHRHPRFNSRSRGGSDPARKDEVARFVGFNSRSRGGSDNESKVQHSVQDVSIHAPAGGATSSRMEEEYISSFQFTLPRGERPQRPPRQVPQPCFNSRSRGGSDRANGSWRLPLYCFNSRSRGGSDNFNFSR